MDWTTLKRVLWEGSFSNSDTGEAKAITLTDSIDNYETLEVELGLNNWGENNGITKLRLSAKAHGSPVSIIYATEAGALIKRVGVLQKTNNGNGLIWQDNRSYEQTSYTSDGVFHGEITPPTASDGGLNLYKVVGLAK